MAVRERLAIGRIQRGHGTEGWLRVTSHSGDTTHLAGLAQVYLGTAAAPETVEHTRVVSGAVLLKLRGVDAKEVADRLQGTVLWVERDRASPLAPGEYYVGDLCGCAVYQGARSLGVVSAFVEGGATELLEVKGPDGETFLVPFADAYVGEVSVERSVVELREAFEVPVAPGAPAGRAAGRGLRWGGRRPAVRHRP